MLLWNVHMTVALLLWNVNMSGTCGPRRPAQDSPIPDYGRHRIVFPRASVNAAHVVGLSFVLQDLETGRIVGHALVCAEARYASVLDHRALRIERTPASPFQWLCVEEQLERRIPGGPLHRASAIVGLLVDEPRRASVTVEHLMSTPLDLPPDTAAETLDEHLLQIASERN